MDFDLSKENIQPLRGGRNAAQLELALQAQTNVEFQRELMRQKEEFERKIQTYTGNDPLENWYQYITWIEQSYPKRGHEGNLVPMLEQCLRIFEKDKRYTNDRRLCKLLIKYIDQQENPIELYHMLYSQGLCRGRAEMYKAWAYYHEAAGDFQSAHRVFECGKREIAQPYDDLIEADKNLVIAAGQHMIYGSDENILFEKRQALTALHTYKPGKVGSVRIPSGSGAGVFGTAAPVASRSNAPIQIYEGNEEAFGGAEAAPVSLLTIARRHEISKENTLKPGMWTTVPCKKRPASQKRTPGFTVHQDDDDENSNVNVHTKFPETTSENYSNWVINLTIPEPHDDKVIPMYPKAKVYADIGVEYSLEELRSLRYRKNMSQVHSSETDQAVQSILEGSHNMGHKFYGTPGKNSVQNNSNMEVKEEEEEEGVFSSFNKQQSLIKTEVKSNTSPATWNPSTQQPQQSLVEEQNTVKFDFDIWNSLHNDTTESPVMIPPRPKGPSFKIYEQSSLGIQERMEPKGSAMKTPFKDLNAEELAETGSRGGMDVAAAAPVDSAKRLPVYDDDSSSYDKLNENLDLSCNTQMFCFNLNAMQVSTPQNKQEQPLNNEDSTKAARKQLFTDANAVAMNEKRNRTLSVIFEETAKSYGHSSSSSSGSTAAKSSLLSNHTKPNNMATISEEHNSYLAQNLMANAALRTSLLGNLMDFNSPVSPVLCAPNQIATEAPPTPRVQESTEVAPIDYIPSNPFGSNLIDELLLRVRFPGPHTRGYYEVPVIKKLCERKETVTIGADKYSVEKQLGKGTFGVVFRGTDLKTGRTVALKMQTPANKWEYYICRELQSRLVNHSLRDRFMDVRIGYFSDQNSVLISEFIPNGSLLQVVNMVKQKSGRAMKESLCIFFCLEMLKIVQAMHDVKIIHADIKPDNFLVQLINNDTVALQLIDFGCSIDMSLFPPDATFKRKITTENFICCEMLDGRPWSYHTDLFCVAATAHVLLFEKYIQLRKTEGHWSISHRIPRYSKVDLWNMFFSTLLNQQNGPADSQSLQTMLESSLLSKFDDYHNDMRYLINMLKNR